MCRVTNTCRVWWLKKWVSFKTSEIEEELFHNIKKKCNTNPPAILHRAFVHVMCIG
jgi:hypothetical protein